MINYQLLKKILLHRISWISSVVMEPENELPNRQALVFGSYLIQFNKIRMCKIYEYFLIIISVISFSYMEFLYVFHISTYVLHIPLTWTGFNHSDNNRYKEQIIQTYLVLISDLLRHATLVRQYKSHIIYTLRYNISFSCIRSHLP
jgi:hypothetical protein